MAIIQQINDRTTTRMSKTLIRDFAEDIPTDAGKRISAG
jgi:hypothetical protein